MNNCVRLCYAVLLLVTVVTIARCAVVPGPRPEQAGLRWSEVVVARGAMQEQKQVFLENDLVRIAFLPGAGGRVVSYIDKGTGINHLYQNNGLRPEDAGGLWDKEGVWPTTNLCDHPFAYAVNESPGELQLTFRADLGNLRVTKRFTLSAGSSRLTLEATYENIGPASMRYLTSHLLRFAVGDKGGSEDYVIYPEGEGLVKRAFGSPQPEGPTDVAPCWWMVHDSASHESLLVTFEPDPLLAERVVAFGDGHVDLEFHTRRHLAQPGESLKLRWDLRLLKDAGELANARGGWSWLAEPEQSRMVEALTGLLQVPSFLDVGEQVLVLPWGVASFSVPRRVIKQPDTLDVIAKVQTGSQRAAEMPPAGLRMRLWVDDHFAPSEIAWTTLPRDTMQARSLHLATAALAQGHHKLRLRVEAGGREFALETEFAVIDEQILKRRIEQAQNKANELAEAARRAGNELQIAAAASCAMRAEDARRKFIMGPAFEEWGNTAHATDVNAMPLNLNPGAGPGDVDYVLRVLAEAEGWIGSLEGGRDPFSQRHGLFQKAFYSRVDGSLQPYTVYIPQKYDGRIALPLLVLLHGSGGDQWEIPQAAANLDGRSVFRGALEREPVESNFILCAPLARGPSGYQHLAEIDILQMLDEVQRDYRIDADRVYVTGWSMGGAGTWGLASRFPDRFAAIMPIAGSNDTLLLENTRHIPCWYFHGLGDTEVNPGFLKVTENAYQRLGLTYYNGLLERPFVFAPDTDHWVGYRMTGSFAEIEKILSQYRRVAFPRSVTLVASELRHNRAYWVRMDSFERYWEPAKLTAQIDGNMIQITSHNVSQFTLFLSRELVDMN